MILPETFEESKRSTYLTYRFLNTTQKVAEIYKNKWQEMALWPSSLFLPEHFFYFEDRVLYGFYIQPMMQNSMMFCSEIRFKNFVDFTGFNLLQNSIQALLDYEEVFVENCPQLEYFLQFDGFLSQTTKAPNFAEYAVFADFDEGLTFFKHKFFNGSNQ